MPSLAAIARDLAASVDASSLWGVRTSLRDSKSMGPGNCRAPPLTLKCATLTCFARVGGGTRGAEFALAALPPGRVANADREAGLAVGPFVHIAEVAHGGGLGRLDPVGRGYRELHPERRAV